MLHQPPLTARTLLTTSLWLGGGFVIGWYVLFQARFLILGPQITLVHEPAFLQNQRRVELTGSTQNISHLWLNDRQIFTNASGHFTEAFILETGYTTVTLRAEDRYGRETTVERSFVYAPMTFTQ